MSLPSLRDIHADPTPRAFTVAHRGAWHDNAENSLASIEAAIAMGCAMVEIDVQQSADGTLFAFHDGWMRRMTGREVMPSALAWQDLHGTRLRQRDGGATAPLSDQHMPTLNEVLELTRGRIHVDLDAKERNIVPAVAQAAKAMGCADEVNVKGWMMSATDIAEGLAWSRELPCVVKPLIFVGTSNFDAVRDLIEQFDPPVVEAFFEELPLAFHLAEHLRAQGRDLFVNTLDAACSTGVNDSQALVDPEGRWGKLADAGIRFLQTDEPEAMQTWLNGTLDQGQD
ncbi:glycerophosphodiester phosphodiesterase family protein (plasmid) [Thioclava sp. 'Guangxiensis']|uniref:glycerophosphodiester phosphodiesterase family protein n=1 Tax=Thioclava sp. 'Guangxiensis' TaxID=3149044 RepID=UPI0032C42258